MSKKSTKKAKSLSTPRTMTEIQAAYQQLCASAGQVQYQLKIYSKELDSINDRLQAVNNEAAARQQLDKESERNKQEENNTQTVAQGDAAQKQVQAV